MQLGSRALSRGCAIAGGLPSPNFGPRRGGARPSLIVLHYTAMATAGEARARLCDPAHEVSAHWLVDEAGHAEALVDEGARAWHAGAGAWARLTDINSHSIGIELANRGDHPFAARQMDGLESLLAAIMTRWAIPPHRVIAHSDMAPSRKSDPGPRFDWQRLARAGLSVWPQATAPTSPGMFWAACHRFGYPFGHAEAAPLDILRAFRLRFRPMATGMPDGWDGAMMGDLARRFPVDPAPPLA